MKTRATKSRKIDVPEKLLPCPFCGSEAELKHLKPGPWVVVCKSGQCAMMTSFARNAHDEEGITSEIKHRVVMQWNMRVPTKFLVRLLQADLKMERVCSSLFKYAWEQAISKRVRSKMKRNAK